MADRDGAGTVAGQEWRLRVGTNPEQIIPRGESNCAAANHSMPAQSDEATVTFSVSQIARGGSDRVQAATRRQELGPLPPVATPQPLITMPIRLSDPLTEVLARVSLSLSLKVICLTLRVFRAGVSPFADTSDSVYFSLLQR